jgi:16S rRNA (adenine1518-N6/adenine1519-N6)-dimethyltransferase
MSAIDTLPPLREVIAPMGCRREKALGQNFLLDLNLTAKIARVAGDLTGDRTCWRSGPAPAG